MWITSKNQDGRRTADQCLSERVMMSVNNGKKIASNMRAFITAQERTREAIGPSVFVIGGLQEIGRSVNGSTAVMIEVSIGISAHPRCRSLVHTIRWPSSVKSWSSPSPCKVHCSTAASHFFLQAASSLRVPRTASRIDEWCTILSGSCPSFDDGVPSLRPTSGAETAWYRASRPSPQRPGLRESDPDGPLRHKNRVLLGSARHHQPVG
jgi:hypothetical protein